MFADLFAYLLVKAVSQKFEIVWHRSANARMFVFPILPVFLIYFQQQMIDKKRTPV